MQNVIGEKRILDVYDTFCKAQLIEQIGLNAGMYGFDLYEMTAHTVSLIFYKFFCVVVQSFTDYGQMDFHVLAIRVAVVQTQRISATAGNVHAKGVAENAHHRLQRVHDTEQKNAVLI